MKPLKEPQSQAQAWLDPPPLCPMPPFHLQALLSWKLLQQLTRQVPVHVIVSSALLRHYVAVNCLRCMSVAGCQV